MPLKHSAVDHCLKISLLSISELDHDERQVQEAQPKGLSSMDGDKVFTNSFELLMFKIEAMCLHFFFFLFFLIYKEK